MATQSMKISSVLRIAGVYIGSVVGAGFASGREIWTFFARFGCFGLIGIAAAAGLFCILAPLLMRTMRIGSISQYGDMYRRYLTPKAASLLDSATTVYLFCVLSVMFAGSTSLIGTVLRLDPYRSAAISAVLLIALAAMGSDWVATASSLLCPVLVAGICLLCGEHTFTGPVAPFANAGLESVTCMVVGASVSSLVYVSYNMLLCLGVFASLASSKHTMTELIGGGILGGAVLGIMAFLVLVTLTAEPAAVSVDMPLLSIAHRRGGDLPPLPDDCLGCNGDDGPGYAVVPNVELRNPRPEGLRLGEPHIERRTGRRSLRSSDWWLGPALVVLCVPVSYVGFGLLVDRTCSSASSIHLL